MIYQWTTVSLESFWHLDIRTLTLCRFKLNLINNFREYFYEQNWPKMEEIKQDFGYSKSNSENSWYQSSMETLKNLSWKFNDKISEGKMEARRWIHKIKRANLKNIWLGSNIQIDHWITYELKIKKEDIEKEVDIQTYLNQINSEGIATVSLVKEEDYLRFFNFYFRKPKKKTPKRLKKFLKSKNSCSKYFFNQLYFRLKFNIFK